MNEEQIKKMFQDLLDQHQKGLVKDKTFIEAITELAMKTIQESLKLEDVDALKKNVKTLQDEIKTLRSGALVESNTKQLNGLYRGVWKSAELARDFGLFALASVLGSKKAADKLQAKGYILEKSMNADNLTEGGLLVPQQIIDGLIMLIGEYGVFRRNAGVMPMSSDSGTGMRLDSGLTVYCVAAGVAPTESKPGFSAVGLNAKEWLTYTCVDNNLSDDAAIMIGDLLGELIAVAFAEKEDLIGFMGTGIAAHFGFIGIKGQFDALATPAGVITSAYSTWATLVLGDFLSMQGKIHSKGRKGAKWYCSAMFYYTVMRRLALAAGGVYAKEVEQSDVNETPYFLGKPVEFVEDMPTATATSQLCCFYGDLKRGAWLGDRRQTTIAKSEHYKFAERQTAVLGSERVAITVYGCGDDTNAGTIVALKTGAGG
jgi:HK97 family phage major capsid protein